MARRPDRSDNDVLSEEELKQLRHSLAQLSETGVRDFYQRAHEECRMVFDRLPSPRQVQSLIQAWKQLWKWKR